MEAKLLTPNEEQTLVMMLPKLTGGAKAHANELLNGADPTGGTIKIEDQVFTLFEQYHAYLSRDDI